MLRRARTPCYRDSSLPQLLSLRQASRNPAFANLQVRLPELASSRERQAVEQADSLLDG